MVMAKGVPDNDIGLFDGAIGLGPLREAIPTGVLVGVVPRRVFFLGMIGRNP
jgi:hypothetical protein